MVVDSLEEKNTSSVTDVPESLVESASSAAGVDLKFFAKKVTQDLLALKAPEDQVREAVIRLSKLYTQSQKNAEDAFQKIHDSFAVAKDAGDIVDEEMNKLKNEAQAQAQGLGRLADQVEGMNVAKARLLARLGLGIPGIKRIAGALDSLASLELDMKGLGIEHSVFGTIADFIRKTDETLKSRGVDIKGDSVASIIENVKGRAAGLIEDDSVKGMVSEFTGLAEKFGIDIKELANGLAKKATGVDVNEVKAGLEELAKPTNTPPKQKQPAPKPASLGK